MDKGSLLGIIGSITVFVSLLLAMFLLTVKTRHKLSNILFASFLIISAIDISGFFIYHFIYNYPNLEIFRERSSFLIMPLFYLYILSVCYSDFKLRKKHLLHAIPFVIANLVMIPGFYLADTTTKVAFFENFSKMPENIFIRFFIEFQFIFYITATFLALKKFKQIYLENYTDPTTITYKWLLQITVLSCVAHSIVILKNLSQYTAYTDITLWAHLVVAFIALFVLCCFVLKALYYPELFRGVDSRLQLVGNILPGPETGKTPVIIAQEDAVMKDNITRLKEYMLQEAPYLEPSLTVQDLANQMKMPVRDLSILINHHLDQHFFDFVNEYRIQKAMQILKDPAKKEFTIQEILYEVGFNSKSSFNTAFKKYTDLTPSQYRTNSLQTT